jgi:molybdopterin converting factor small subunit
MNIRLAVFGAFRAYAETGELALTLPEGATVADLRQAFRHALADKPSAAALVGCSVFADAEDVLGEDDRLEGRTGLAVLPPVSGG